MLSTRIRFVAALLASAAVVASGPAEALTGRVVNAETHAPIEGATVTLGDKSAVTNANGDFDVAGEGRTIQLRAPGFQPQGSDAERAGGRRTGGRGPDRP